jgi:hypothetical protein
VSQRVWRLFTCRSMFFIALPVFVLLVIISLVLYLDLQQARREARTTKEIIYSTQTPPGRSCGVMPRREAEKILGGPVAVVYSNVPAPFSGKEEGLGNGWLDTCRLTSTADSASYIDIILHTMATNEQANDMFKREVPEFGLYEQLDAEKYDVTQAVYQEGVVYAQKGTLFLSVGAGKDSPWTSEKLTKDVFATVIERLN